MLLRFGALALVGGLGIGLLLRIVLGRRRFPTLVALAHVPLALHVLLAAWGGLSDGAPSMPVLTFLAAGLVLAVLGAVLGARFARSSPWLAALMPGIVGAAYTLVPFLLFERAVSLTAAAGRLPLTSYGIFFFLLAAVLAVSLLLPFAPQASGGRRW